MKVVCSPCYRLGELTDVKSPIKTTFPLDRGEFQVQEAPASRVLWR